MVAICKKKPNGRAIDHMKNLKVLFRYIKTFSRSNQYDILSKYTFKGCFFTRSLFPKLLFHFLHLLLCFLPYMYNKFYSLYLPHVS